MQVQVQEVPENKFDLITHRWDKQGNPLAKNPYRLHIRQGNYYFERPVNSGNLWLENNQPAGRIEIRDGKKVFLVGEEAVPHKAYIAPLEGAEALQSELAEAKAQNEALLAELEAIRSEKAKKSAPEGALAAAIEAPAVKEAPKLKSKIAAPEGNKNV
jgi:hypothetical protein